MEERGESNKTIEIVSIFLGEESSGGHRKRSVYAANGAPINLNL